MKNVVQAALKDRIKDDTQKRQEQMDLKKKQQRESERETKQKI